MKRSEVIELLKYAKVVTGKTISAKYDDQEREMIVDEILYTFKKFGYIVNPIEVVKDYLKKDKDFYGLTPQKVFHYLSDYWTSLPSGKRYQLMGLEKTEEVKPMNPEEAEKYIKLWKKNLAKIQEPKPIRTQTRFYDKEYESLKLEFQEIDCRHCEGEGCNHCNNLGRIKIIKH